MDLEKRQTRQAKGMGFVTVVSVGIESASAEPCLQNKQNETTAHPGYVTILAVGETGSGDEATEEEVLIYRLPGERLGFGLKFEGGTKAVEFVKRLFIQSCAPDSPASRVKCSWGKLIEGDEIIEIDSKPINKMTRLDCVKCLKDSNVIIKLLVRHVNAKTDFNGSSDFDKLPQQQVEEKINNTPPPVPPRKTPRKFLRESSSSMTGSGVIVNDGTTLSRHEELRKNGNNNRLQSPRSSGKYVSVNNNRECRTSDGIAGPPDAEIYIDLFSQESTYSLSESDETGSSISTVVDRLSSYPTTSNSSFAGSSPSTPTTNPKNLNLNLSNFISDADEFDFDANDARFKFETNDAKGYEQKTKNSTSILLQPASNFPDAQLSYGNEDVKMMETSLKLLLSQSDGENNPPSLPPRRLKSPPTCCPLEKNNNVFPANINNNDNQNEKPDDDKNDTVLPRLVDFVPKPLPYAENLSVNRKVIQLFIDNEKRLSNELSEFYWHYQNSKGTNDDTVADLQNWSTSSQLSTIGEDDEEASLDGDRCGCSGVVCENPQSHPVPAASCSLPIVPIVTVENADEDGEKSDGDVDSHEKNSADDAECPPSCSRQPPDGHEFPIPNYQEVKQTRALENNFAFNKDSSVDVCGKVDLICKDFLNDGMEEAVTNFGGKNESPQGSADVFAHQVHVRSQSLVDISTTCKRDNWSLLLEQRRRGLSKLKGLVIPESTAETEITVDIPEIKIDVPASIASIKIEPKQFSLSSNSSTPCLSTPPWSSPNTNGVPKYSPAFKRKSLQIYGTTPSPKLASKHYLKLQDDPTRNTEDPSKSLESISSPTQSDHSFDYSYQISKKDCKNEDESDNDSAVSSNQSNVSKHSPPNSPSFDAFSVSQENRRLLKPRSVEAINRKNILASAKCRSGYDVKLIRQKYENEQKNDSAIKGKIDGPLRNVEKAKTDVVRNLIKKIDLTESKTKTSINENGKIKKTPQEENSSSNIKKLRNTFENTLNKQPSKNSTTPKKSEVKENGELTKNSINASELITELGENVTKNDLKIVNLRPEIMGGSLGITLAGGTDYEVKDITVHKIRNESIACKDGRLKKGDRILSINGKSTKGLTHEEAVAILKESVPLVTIIAYKTQDDVITDQKNHNSNPAKVDGGNIKTITLKKDSAGLGFSMEGGRESLEGDRPLLIKKIFKGGSAEKSGLLNPGDEIMAINDIDLTKSTKVDAWSLMKKLPEGEVTLSIRR